jgi:hypothetical protein
MSSIHTISVLLEIIVVALGILIALGKKKKYGWFIALTYVLYVIYDLANFWSLNISKDLLYIIFLVATLSVLWAIWNIFLEA